MKLHAMRGLLLMGSMSLAGCVGASKPVNELPAGGHWRLASSDVVGLEGGASTGIWIEVSEQGLSGDSGCNRFQATLSFEKERMRVGPIASTKRGCVDPKIDQAERALYRALPEVQQAFVQGDRLRLQLADGSAMDFVAESVTAE